LLLDPFRELLVLLVPAQRRADEVALEPRHTRVERRGEIEQPARARLGRAIAQRRLQVAARAVELEASVRTLELQQYRALRGHGFLLRRPSAAGSARRRGWPSRGGNRRRRLPP